MKFSNSISRLWSLIYPERCIFCSTLIHPQTLFCSACRDDIEIVTPPICTDCGCRKSDCHCRHRRHLYDGHLSPFYYAGAAQRGVLRLKNRPDPALIDYLAIQMVACLRREYPTLPFDAVTYVPMTAADRRNRGYNQSELLAKKVAAYLQLPLTSELVKPYQTAPQKSLRLEERRGNLLGAFDVRSRHPVAKRILLVDDILTTGATAEECSKILKLFGATKVVCLTATTVKPHYPPHLK